MALQNPVHSPTGSVYHDNDECPRLAKMDPENLRSGTGSKRLCRSCSKLNEGGITLNKSDRLQLYAASRYLRTKLEQKMGIQIPFQVYLQDPLVATEDPLFGFDEKFYVKWEPGLADGPTSSRFAVVDYNGDAEELAPPAQWSSEKNAFVHGETILDKQRAEADPHQLQFHQVNVWAVLQRALLYYEEPFGMGRSIPWGFRGNKLIVVPHAGYGRNAFYDKTSKSLQFYYFNEGEERVYTCLSTDIINHEFGHAVLDGIRPYLSLSTLVETGAFHEFIGDLTAILIIMRNNKFRQALADKTKGILRGQNYLTAIARQFGIMVTDRPYLRTADNRKTMSKLAPDDGPHTVSEVLTGTMFDMIVDISKSYKDRVGTKKMTWREALSHTVRKMQLIALQPLDFLPPVDVTFNDYARAVLRAFRLAVPDDPHDYYQLILDAFVRREILNKQEAEKLKDGKAMAIRPKIFYSVEEIARSKMTAYHFLNDNRDTFNIPDLQDFEVIDLYEANKFTQRAYRLPRQTILQYLWYEEVLLKGERFGPYDGKYMTMPCGGTVVFDENNNILSWIRKPGTAGGRSEQWQQEIKLGEHRRTQLLNNLAARIKARHVGSVLGTEKGLLGMSVPQLTVEDSKGGLTFRMSPHMNLQGEVNEDQTDISRWEISS